MAATTVLKECPHCRAKLMTFNCVTEAKCSTGTITFWQCAGCTEGVLIKKEVSLSRIGRLDNVTMWPKLTAIEVPEFTPDSIGDFLKEAKKSFATGATTASAIMARKSLEETVKHFGATGNNLKEKINDLGAKGLITQSFVNWAHEVRYIGNDAAHESSPVSKEDAQQAVSFTEMFLTYVFTMPGQIAVRRSKSTTP